MPSRTVSRGAVLVAVLVACASAQLNTKDWPQFGRFPDFQSYHGVANPATPPHKEWSYDVKFRAVASTAVGLGRVVGGSDGGFVFCLNQTTGGLMWSFTAGDKVRSSPAMASDGSVVFGTYGGLVFRVDAEGKEVWRYRGFGTIYAPATISPDGAVLIGSEVGAFYKLDFKTGALIWKYQTTGPMNSGAAIGSGQFADTIVMRSYNTHVYAISLKSGKEIWAYKTGGSGGSSATIVGDLVYVGSWDKKLYALSMATGAVVWSFTTGGEIESHPAYHAGIVYTSTEEDHALWALNATTGKMLWKFDKPTAVVNGSPSISKDLVYFGANDKYMWVLDRVTGKFRFKFETCANVFSSGAIADNGMIYFTCNSGTALDGANDAGLGEVYAVNPSLHM